MNTRWLVTVVPVLAVWGMTACRRVPPAAAPTAVSALPAACRVPTSASTASLAASPVSDPLVTFDTAWAIIARTHWDTTYNGVNWRAVRDELRPKAAAATSTGELRAVLSDMVGRLKQSHFSIIPREAATVGTSGSSSGSSAAPGDASGSVGFEVRLLDGALVVSRVDPAGPAAQAGVAAGWVLESVGGCPMAARLARLPASPDPRRTSLAAYSVATQALDGAAGDTVQLTFRDGSQALRSMALVRGPEPGTIIKFGNLPPLSAHLEYGRVQQNGRTIGVIRFNIWMLVLAPQFDAAMDALRDTDAIVLDLRGNFGGVGGMSMGIAGHFFDTTRTIGTMHQRGSSLRFIANPRRVNTKMQSVTPYAGPVALVVDELSVSTTEIFAGGMQALGRARVFGVQTAGQALPSVPERLPNGDVLYHAIADFTSPTGAPLEGPGVTPQAVTPLSRRALLRGADPALDAALTWAAQQSRIVP